MNAMKIFSKKLHKNILHVQDVTHKLHNYSYYTKSKIYFVNHLGKMFYKISDM